MFFYSAVNATASSASNATTTSKLGLKHVYIIHMKCFSGEDEFNEHGKRGKSYGCGLERLSS